jgi:hypothetical protein
MDTQEGQLTSFLTDRLYPYCQGIAARQLTDFPSVSRHGVKRDPIWQSDRAVSPHAYFAAGGAVVGLGPSTMPARTYQRMHLRLLSLSRKPAWARRSARDSAVHY